MRTAIMTRPRVSHCAMHNQTFHLVLFCFEQRSWSAHTTRARGTRPHNGAALQSRVNGGGEGRAAQVHAKKQYQKHSYTVVLTLLYGCGQHHPANVTTCVSAAHMPPQRTEPSLKRGIVTPTPIVPETNGRRIRMRAPDFRAITPARATHQDSRT